MDTPLTHAQLMAALARFSVAMDASELDGLVAGYVCGGGTAGREQLPQALQLEADEAGLVDVLASLREASIGRVQDLDMGLEPLLPADSASLRERADALVSWTRGLLGGFGLAGATAEALSDDGREVLQDLASIAVSNLALDEEAGDDGDEDESALIELREFVRVGAMLLHADMAAAAPPASERTH